jgi:MerR family transcriptional regulator, light-induced transcriptional regulator
MPTCLFQSRCSGELELTRCGVNVVTNLVVVYVLNSYNQEINGSITGHSMKKPDNSMKETVQARDAVPSYRSGVAARLAGLSVETLRVWERRYGLSDTERSEHGQRLYSAEQVGRLRLLKNLVDQGHPIGLIAGLPIGQLEELSSARAPDQPNAAGPIRIALVGRTLKERLAAGGRESLPLDVRCHAAMLDQAMAVLPDSGAEVLVVEISEPDESVVPLIVQARETAQAKAVVLLYRFCSSATIRQLRMHDCLVARVPTDMGELVMLCRTALAGQRIALKTERGAEPAPPVFDEESLTTLATANNKVGCECPRHLAEILLMVGSFERYSMQCASKNPEDAQLHQELGRAAGQARSVLEEAMERLVRAEGLKH